MKRMTDYLLDAIWTGQVSPVRAEDYTELHRGLNALLPYSKIFLAVPEGMFDGRVFSDDTEAMPGLPLGDVLAEELDIDVPYGTVVICCAETAKRETVPLARRSATMGAICAEVLVDAVQLGTYRLERERDVLSILGNGIAIRASAVGSHHGGLASDIFRKSLSRRVAAITGLQSICEAHCDATAGASVLEGAESVAKSGSGKATTGLAQVWRENVQSLLQEVEPGVVTPAPTADPRSAQFKV